MKDLNHYRVGATITVRIEVETEARNEDEACANVERDYDNQQVLDFLSDYRITESELDIDWLD